MLNDELTIILVTYNSRDMVAKCLDSIEEGKFNITIIDNASNDDTAAFITQKYPDINLIKCEKNIGFGRALNIGLKQAKTPFALTMNPDVITSASAIEYLLDATKQNPQAAIYAPRTKGAAKPDHGTEIKKVSWLSGAVMLFDLKKFDKLGFFDENIFLYYEETDLCKRVHDSGLGLILFNNIYMDHLVGKSSITTNEIDYMKYWHMAWSRFYFNHKHLNSAEYCRKISGYLLKFIIQLAINTISGNKKKAVKYRASLAGGISFLMGRKAFDSKGNPRGIRAQ